jgi:putative ABC transport system ATP-binding protein
LLLSIQAVTKTYQMGGSPVHALRAVDLDIDHGELVAVMGASGSGKSTLLNILGTLDRPTEGRYVLDGQDVAELHDRELAQFRNRKIGFVFQQFNLLPRYSALANVELPMLYGGVARAERRQRAMEALDRVGLGDRMHHHPNELSGGQQQRVSIARALVQRPPLLLADEPTGALDTETTGQIMELFCELHDSGMTVVVVTHEPDVAAYASRAVRFKDGRILSDQTQDQPRPRGVRAGPGEAPRSPPAGEA